MKVLLPFLIPVVVGQARPSPMAVQIEIDRRFELISIACRLAGFQEYCMGTLQGYNAAVDSHFGPHRNHRVIGLLQELRREGIAYDALPSLAVRVQDSVTLKPLVPLDQPRGLDGRWRPGRAEAFLEALNAFAQESMAEAFFDAQSTFYTSLIRSCEKGLLRHLDQAWFQRTFGGTNRDAFHLCISPLNGRGNYGAAVPDAAGEQRYAFLGTPSAGGSQCPEFDATYLPTLVHEFLHGYANPWIQRHLPELKTSGEALNAPVIELMRAQAYGPPETALKESLVRAFTLCYFQDHGQESDARKAEADEYRNGFYWVGDLAKVLDEFTSNRDRYPDFESFSGRLVEAYRSLAAEAPSKGPACMEMARKSVGRGGTIPIRWYLWGVWVVPMGVAAWLVYSRRRALVSRNE